MIRAVIFDMGGTLEDVYYDDALRVQAAPGLHEILTKHGLNPDMSSTELCAVVQAGMKKYGAWREATEQEVPPERLWSEFIFGDDLLAQDTIAKIGEELAFYWDTRFFTRTLRPGATLMLDALRARGFQLGVISNITSRVVVPRKLAEYNINHYFQTVLTSAAFGYRKPSIKIFLEAARLLGLPPAECAYVGDTISRDVVGAHRAGYGLAIQIKSFLTQVSDKETDTEPPDAIIENLMQVVDLVTHSPEQAQ